MSITQVAFQAHFYAQRIVPVPAIVDPKLLKSYKKPQSKKSSFQAYRLVLFSVLLSLLLFSLCRVIWIYNNFKNSLPTFETAVYSLLCGGVCIVIISFWCSGISNANDLYFLVGHARYLDQLANPITNIVSFQQLVVIGFSLMTLSVSFAFLFAPLRVTFDPIQLMFGTHWSVKIVAGCVPFIMSFVAASSLLCITLMSMSFLETFVIMSARYQDSHNFGISELKFFCKELQLSSDS